ncbi:MAG: hypothetical protein ACP5E4_01280 [Candidatus Aenigmatarchaeota archaeon]
MECTTDEDCNDGLYCNGAETCDIGGTYTCQKGTPVNCAQNDISEVYSCYFTPDGCSGTFDWREGFESECVETDFNQGYCTKGDETVGHVCADADDTDGGPEVAGEIRICKAECDSYGDECLPYIGGDDYCYYDGSCNSSCECGYSSEFCPPAGTVDAGVCYYGGQTCDDKEGCGLSSEEMTCEDTCDPILGPLDKTGPVTSDIVVNPLFNNGIFDLSAIVTDTCSEIKTAEYFVGHMGSAQCGAPGTGTTIYPEDDGSFDQDKLQEEVFKGGIFFYVDGKNYVCVRGQDTAGNWGNCKCAIYQSDIWGPEEPVDVTVNDVPVDPNNVQEILVCGDDPVIKAKVCDFQSDIQGGSYFVDTYISPYSDPWDGFWMTASKSWFEGFYHCANLTDVVEIDEMEDGTHWITLMSGKDDKENWGKILEYNIPIIKDTTPPATEKELAPYGGVSVSCGMTEANGHALTDPCYYVMQGTKINLTATDPDPQGTGEFAGNVVIHYKIWWSEDCETNWVLDDEGASNPDEPMVITLNKDSCHLIEYWSEDLCGNEETHHFEIDIVDTQAPEINKSIVGPSYGDCPPETECDVCFIDGVTKIRVEATDPEPHPVNQVTCDWDYEVTYGVKTGQGQMELSPPFEINFPEESKHVLTITCRDALGNEAVDVETFYVDKTPPTTTKTYGSPYYKDMGTEEEWINSSTPITLKVEDTGPHKSGIAGTYYRVTLVDDEACRSECACAGAQGSGDFDSYSGAFKINEESCHLIEFYSVDNVDKTETVNRQCVYVENTTPITEKTIGEPKVMCTEDEWKDYGSPDFGCYYINQSTKITLDCTERGPHPTGIVTLYYRDYLLNETAPAYTDVSGGYVEITKNEDSEHALEFYCEDALGNTDGVHREIDIVDSQAPVVTKEVFAPKVAGNQSPIHYYLTEESKIALTCEDLLPHPVGDVTLYWELYWSETCEPGCWDSPIDSGSTDGYKEFTGLEDSCHKLVYWCEDALGNTAEEMIEIDAVDNKAPISWKVLTGKQIECSANEKNSYGINDCAYVTQDTLVELYCEDQLPHPVGGETIFYRIDWKEYEDDAWTEGTWAEVSSGYTFTYENDSFHRLTWYCVDALGNEEEKKVELDIVDTQAPVGLKVIGEPKIECSSEELPEAGFDCWWVQDHVTEINLTCEDQLPHPVGMEEVCYKMSFDVPQTPWLTEEYCGQFGGELKGDWCCADASDGQVYTFTFQEDSVHDLEYFCRDGLNNTNEVDLEYFRVDSTPPVTNKTFVGPTYPAGEADIEKFSLEGDQITHFWLRDHVTEIHLDAVDEAEPCDIGVKEIHYRIGMDEDDDEMFNETEKGVWVVVSSSHVDFTIDEDCLHRIEWYAVDLLGNAEDTHIQIHRVDSTPPESWKYFEGPTYPASEEDIEKFSLEGDQITHFWLRDNKTSQDGTWIFIDAYADKEEPCAVGTDYVHIELWRDSTGDDVVDTLVWEKNVSPEDLVYAFQIEEDCLHMIKWYAVDLLGNAEAEHVQYHRVDSTPPTTVKVIEGPICNATEDDIERFELETDEEIETFYLTSNTTITLTATDQAEPCAVGVEGFYYKISRSTDNGETWEVLNDTQALGNSVAFTFEENCLHKIEWYAVDRLGNAETLHVQLHKVDNTPPEIVKLVGWPSLGPDENEETGEDAWWVTTDTKINLDETYDREGQCASGRMKIEYRIWWDKTGQWGEWKEYTGEFNLLGQSTHRLQIRATDCLGNTAEDTETFIVHENIQGSECAVPISYNNYFGWDWRSMDMPKMMVDIYTDDARVWNVMKLMEGKYDIIYFQNYLTGDWSSYMPGRIDNKTGEPLNSLESFGNNPGIYYIKLKGDARYMSYFVINNDLREGCEVEFTECSDMLDNDLDGYWDFGYDVECLSTEDDSEAPVCGDALVEGAEECDEKGDNGVECIPAYGASCVYCSLACENVTLDGGQCGDGTVNGPEDCEAEEDCSEGYYCDACICVEGVTE